MYRTTSKTFQNQKSKTKCSNKRAGDFLQDKSCYIHNNEYEHQSQPEAHIQGVQNY